MQYKIRGKVRLIELFAGIGSQAMALRDLDVEFEHHKVIENDSHAVNSYNLIHNTDFEVRDIKQVTGKELEIVNTYEYEYIMTYSFPCQDLSISGKKKGMTKGSNTRSGLLWEVERLLKEVDNLPQILIMENVTQVVGKKNIKDFEMWLKYLNDLGYSNYYENLNSKNYGVAQNRDRTFMVSILGEHNYKFPEKHKQVSSIEDYLSRGFMVEDEEVIVEIEEKVIKGNKIIKYEIPVYVKLRVYNVNIEEFVAYLKGYKKEVKLTNKQIAYKLEVPNTLVEHWFRTDKYNAIPSDEIWVDLKKVLNIKDTKYDKEVMTYEIRQGKHDQTNRVYDIKGIAPTIMTGTNLRITDRERIRELDTEELWLLMGFNIEDYGKIKNKISDRQIRKQIGNSIVLPVIRDIIKQII